MGINTLTKRDFQDPVWLRHSADLEVRLEELRKQNDHDSTPEETSKLRGRIAEIKAILSLSKPKADED